MLELTEKKFTATRGTTPESYQNITITQEVQQNRQYILFTLNERRWRSKEEAASYLRWCAEVIERLP